MFNKPKRLFFQAIQSQININQANAQGAHLDRKKKKIGFTAVGGEKQGHGSGMLSCSVRDGDHDHGSLGCSPSAPVTLGTSSAPCTPSCILPCRTHRRCEHTPYAISLFSLKKCERWIPSEGFSPPFLAAVLHRAALLTEPGSVGCGPMHPPHPLLWAIAQPGSCPAHF